MDFDFSDDQAQLREACARWVSRSYGFERRRAIVAAGGFSRQAYGELAELGLCALYVPEVHGGMGMGPIEAMVVLEELGRGMVLEPLAQTLLCSAVFAGHGSSELQGEWLPGMASGERLVVLAQQERQARYRLDTCAATATSAASGWVINATKNLVSAGDQADAFVVPAMVEGQMGLFLVERGAQGVGTRGYLMQDGSRAADLVCVDTPAALLTRDGLTALADARDVGIAAVCAEAVGAMDQTLALTVDYLNTRRQFGVAIGSFQALRHRVADMKMQLELARSMSYYASLKLNAHPTERHMALARAKYQLGVSMRFVGQQAVQLHGGIGVTDEYIVSHFFKKLTQLEMSFGDTLHHLGEVARGMQDTAGVFA